MESVEAEDERREKNGRPSELQADDSECPEPPARLEKARDGEEQEDDDANEAQKREHEEACKVTFEPAAL